MSDDTEGIWRVYDTSNVAKCYEFAYCVEIWMKYDEII